MSEVGFLIQSTLVVALTASPVVILVRLIAGRDGHPAAGIGMANVRAWPRGVQEEEPRPWSLGASRS